MMKSHLVAGRLSYNCKTPIVIRSTAICCSVRFPLSQCISQVWNHQSKKDEEPDRVYPGRWLQETIMCRPQLVVDHTAYTSSWHSLCAFSTIDDICPRVSPIFKHRSKKEHTPYVLYIFYISYTKNTYKTLTPLTLQLTMCHIDRRFLFISLSNIEGYKSDILLYIDALYMSVCVCVK